MNLFFVWKLELAQFPVVHFLNFHLFPDILSRIPLSLIDSGTKRFERFPGSEGLHIFRPEREGTALHGSHRIDAACVPL